MSLNISGIAFNTNFEKNIASLSQLLNWELEFVQEVSFEAASSNFKDEAFLDLYYGPAGSLIFLSSMEKFNATKTQGVQALNFSISDTDKKYLLQYFEDGSTLRYKQKHLDTLIQSLGEPLEIEKAIPDISAQIFHTIDSVAGVRFSEIDPQSVCYRYRIINKKSHASAMAASGEAFKDAEAKSIRFFGEGSKYFGIIVINLLLTVITLGLYYPWAKAAIRKYMWNETELDDSRFEFHGTGKEMFKGFIIAYALFFGLFLMVSLNMGGPWMFAAIILFYVGMILLIPIALFGAWRYRISRTSWRGVFGSFSGKLKEFIGIYFLNGLLTIITFGIYAAWMRTKLMEYLFAHSRFGNLDFDFKGKGVDLFVINLIFGIIFSFGYFMLIALFAGTMYAITMGGSTPDLSIAQILPMILGGIVFMLFIFGWTYAFSAKRFEFTINNTIVSDGENKAKLKSTLTTKEAIITGLRNGLITLGTLGIGFPWVMMNTMKMYLNNIKFPGGFDLDHLEQNSEMYNNATGDELLDVLDIGLDF